MNQVAKCKIIAYYEEQTCLMQRRRFWQSCRNPKWKAIWTPSFVTFRFTYRCRFVFWLFSTTHIPNARSTRVGLDSSDSSCRKYERKDLRLCIFHNRQLKSEVRFTKHPFYSSKFSLKVCAFSSCKATYIFRLHFKLFISTIGRWFPAQLIIIRWDALTGCCTYSHTS